jgi:hypothetical protein
MIEFKLTLTYSAKLSHIVTNALLFIDVLAFRQYLIHGRFQRIFKKN